jgi:hypothetical protein
MVWLEAAYIILLVGCGVGLLLGLAIDEWTS